MAAAQARERAQGEVDELICILAPELLEAEAAWYKEFPETSDTQARALLERAGRRGGGCGRERGASRTAPRSRNVTSIEI